MNPSAIAFLAAGGAVLAPELLGAAVRAGVLPVTPYVTEAQAAAWSSLSPAILGITPPQPGAAEYNALNRATSIQRALIPVRGQAAANVAKLTADDLDELLTRFLAASSAGVAHGYRVASMLGGIGGLPTVDDTYQARVMDALGSGTHPKVSDLMAGGTSSKVTLTPLGAAALAAAVERNRVRLLQGFGLADAVTGARVVGRLAIEMDEQGYLITGKPPDDPTIAGGLNAALDAVADLPGKVITTAAEYGLSAAFSKLGMVAIAGLVVWKVATR